LVLVIAPWVAICVMLIAYSPAWVAVELSKLMPPSLADAHRGEQASDVAEVVGDRLEFSLVESTARLPSFWNEMPTWLRVVNLPPRPSHRLAELAPQLRLDRAHRGIALQRAAGLGIGVVGWSGGDRRVQRVVGLDEVVDRGRSPSRCPGHVRVLLPRP
jgi:hypothetical protein